MTMFRKNKEILLTIATLALLSSVFLLRPYVVTGGSMEPTYSEGTVVLAEKLTPLIRVWRGEVLVIRNPHDKKVVEIKRVVGLPGETVEMGQEGVIINPDCSRGALEEIKGAPCNTLFEAGTSIGGKENGTFAIKLGPEDYMVLGDNRSKSSDSRTFGAVQKADIIGHVMIKL